MNFSRKQQSGINLLTDIDHNNQLHSIGNIRIKQLTLGSLDHINNVSQHLFIDHNLFTGLRAELTHVFGLNPIFQTTHCFSIDSKYPSSYSLPYIFHTSYSNDKIQLHGNISTFKELKYTGFISCGNKYNSSKLKVNLSQNQQLLWLFQHEINRSHVSLNIKLLNIQWINNAITGAISGSYFQLLTSRWSVGLETITTINSLSPSELTTESLLNSSIYNSHKTCTTCTYISRYTKDNWVATTQIRDHGEMTMTFWKKVSENFGAGVETNLAGEIKTVVAEGPGLVEGQPIYYDIISKGKTSIAARYDFRQSLLKTQIDSKGKVGVFFETKVSGTGRFLFCGELDHKNNSANIGLGIRFESGLRQEKVLKKDN